MALAGFCKECRRKVWVTPEGTCTRGHSASAVMDVCEMPLSTGDDSNPRSGTEPRPGEAVRTPAAGGDFAIEAYRRDKRLAGPMTISSAQPMKLGQDRRPLEPSPPMSAREAEAEARRFLQEPATFTLEPVWDRAPYTHHLRVIDGPPHLCQDYLVQVQRNE